MLGLGADIVEERLNLIERDGPSADRLVSILAIVEDHGTTAQDLASEISTDPSLSDQLLDTVGDEAERLLGVMDDIYSTLVTFDFNDSITGGLRRRTDTVRAVLERTRGDVTTSLRQAELEQALEALEAKLSE